MMQNDVWSEFTMEDDELDNGAGILYCLRYNGDELKKHQERVVDSIKSVGIYLEEKEGFVYVKYKQELSSSEEERIYLLFEELSCVNEALAYSSYGLSDFKNISHLCDGFRDTYFDLLGKKEMENVRNIVSSFIPQIVKDIYRADSEAALLTHGERKDLSDLLTFAKKQERNLNSGRYTVVESVSSRIQ